MIHIAIALMVDDGNRGDDLIGRLKDHESIVKKVFAVDQQN